MKRCPTTKLTTTILNKLSQSLKVSLILSIEIHGCFWPVMFGYDIISKMHTNHWATEDMKLILLFLTKRSQEPARFTPRAVTVYLIYQLINDHLLRNAVLTGVFEYQFRI